MATATGRNFGWRGDPSDPDLVEDNFTLGIVRDASNIPVGGLYDCVDFLVEEPGVLYKRGGWERHSLALNGTKVPWVGTIHIPTRVAAITDANTLWDVTGENAPQATNLGAVTFIPKEHSAQHLDKLILCDRDGVLPPKKLRYEPGPDSLVLSNLGGSPPPACYSTVYGGRIVLGRGDSSTLPSIINRLWFSPLPDVEADWHWDRSNPASPALSFIDTTYEITGLAATQGVLLIFSPGHVERILGGIPPGETGEDMRLQPVAGVGCIDARSIVHWDEMVIFAGEEGVWLTNGASVESITEKPDGTGIQVYWRSLFPRHRPAGPGTIHNRRQIVGGLINRDFYVVCILDENDVKQDTLMCHLPSRAWTRLANVNALAMAQGRTEEDILELYIGDSSAHYVNRLGDMLHPTSINVNDGDGTPVEPHFKTRIIDPGPQMKAYGFGRMTYQLVDPGNLATLTVETELGVEAFKSNTTHDFHTTGLAGDVHRRRMEIFNDGQGLTYEVTQNGASEETRIYSLESEVRTYPAGADFPN